MEKRRNGKRELTLAVLGGVLLTCVAAVPLVAAAARPAMTLTPATSVPSAIGPAEYFTGRVRVVAALVLAAGHCRAFDTIEEKSSMQTEQTLSERQQAIIPIAAFAATGDMANLHGALERDWTPA